jgi:hypothetical protein
LALQSVEVAQDPVVVAPLQAAALPLHLRPTVRVWTSPLHAVVELHRVSTLELHSYVSGRKHESRASSHTESAQGPLAVQRLLVNSCWQAPALHTSVPLHQSPSSQVTVLGLLLQPARFRFASQKRHGLPGSESPWS